MTILLILALVTLLGTLLIAVELLCGERRLQPLRATPSGGPGPWPLVSIVVAVRNEERHLHTAVTSLLNLSYPAYELIVVDDRSDDRTPAILAELAGHFPQLKVLRVETLPAGWLGKNHALWQGSCRAAGELLLFTDGDIIMEDTVLARAVNRLQSEGLDHLALTPRMTLPGTVLPILGLAFIFSFGIFTRPWRAADPQSPCHIGIGAFNLLRRRSYFAVGGHQTIALRPDDDLKLGKIIKRAGFRQNIAYAPEFLAVEWYASLGEAIRGLEKNTFAGCDYRVGMVIGGVAVQLLFGLWPYFALLLTGGVIWGVNLLIVLIFTGLLMRGAGLHGEKKRFAWGFPLGLCLFSWIMLRTMIRNLYQGGIIWRGTFYPLEQLRRNRI
ncbi:MAG: glycosyltransferase [Desulfuromonadales bacterium]|nr:glycosyltransferase [Desulfuromonadales bacterium]